jgi:isocitrate dehydrogenase kinase/phosphatase
MSGEVWYPVARNDVFPEEFATFLLGNRDVRSVFMKHHAELLTPEFWQACQQKIRAGTMEDFFPYPTAVRFRDASRTTLRAGVTDALPQRAAAS